MSARQRFIETTTSEAAFRAAVLIWLEEARSLSGRETVVTRLRRREALQDH
jgi:hypothetical protein